MAGDRGQLLVVHICWTDNGTPRQETYGPWTVADDLSHMEQISTFLKDWHRATGRVTGRVPGSATLALVVNPTEFPASLILPAESRTPEQVSEFEARWTAERQASATH